MVPSHATLITRDPGRSGSGIITRFNDHCRGASRPVLTTTNGSCLSTRTRERLRSVPLITRVSSSPPRPNCELIPPDGVHYGPSPPPSSLCIHTRGVSGRRRRHRFWRIDARGPVPPLNADALSSKFKTHRRRRLLLLVRAYDDALRDRRILVLLLLLHHLLPPVADE